MGDDEVFPARFADDARVGAVGGHRSADRLPHRVEDGGGAREVRAGQVAAREHRVRDHHGIAGHHVDDARRQARFDQQAHDVVRAQHRRRRRLPDDRAAHQRGRARQVPANGREVERSHGVDEAFETAVVGLVPHPPVGDRLLAVELLRVVRVEAEEVGQLARRVDLGLVRRLRLVEHRGGVERGAPGAGQEFSGLQEDGRAILPRPRRPLALRGDGGLDRRVDFGRARQVIVAEHVPMVVRHHGAGGLAGAHVLAVDHHRDVDALGRHRVEARLQLGALRRARSVAPDGFVDGRGNLAATVEGHHTILMRTTGSRLQAAGYDYGPDACLLP